MDKKDIPLYLALVIFAVAGLVIINNSTKKLAVDFLDDKGALSATARNSSRLAVPVRTASSNPEFVEAISKREGEGYKETRVSGTMYVYFEEKDFESENPYKTVIVSDNGDVYDLVNESLAPIDPRLSGTKISLAGVSDGNSRNGRKELFVNLDSNELKNLKIPTKTPRSWVAGNRNAPCGGNFCALVFLVDATGGQTNLPAPADVHDYIFNGRVKDLFTEQSGGAMEYGGFVTEWISSTSPIFNFWSAPPEVVQYVLANNIIVDNYDQVVFLVNNGQSDNGGVASLGDMYLEIGGSTFWKPVARIGFSSFYNRADLTMANGNLSYFDHVYVHETGHNLRAIHDNLKSCYSGPISMPSECVHVEYGNKYSTMGGGQFGSHFSFLNKLRVGWMSVYDINFANIGSHSLVATELPTAGFLAFDKGLDAIPEYVFERRESIGFDTATLFSQVNLDGTFTYRTDTLNLIESSSDPLTWAFDLVDTSPGKRSENWSTSIIDAVLKLPQKFPDTQRGMGFRQNPNGFNNLVMIYPLPMTSNSCTARPVKVFEPEGSNDVFVGQLHKHRWPAIFSPLSQFDITEISGNVNDPAAEVLVYKNIMTFNDDSISCSPSDYTFKFIFNGQELSLFSGDTETYPSWSGPYYETVFGSLPIYGLSYGLQTVTLEITKSSDGSVFSEDLVFELVP